MGKQAVKSDWDLSESHREFIQKAEELLKTPGVNYYDLMAIVQDRSNQISCMIAMASLAKEDWRIVKYLLDAKQVYKSIGEGPMPRFPEFPDLNAPINGLYPMVSFPFSKNRSDL